MQTVKVDDYKRIRLASAEPRQVFTVESGGSGRIVLTPVISVEPKPNKVRFEKHGGRTVGVIEAAQFDEAALQQALADFP